MVWAPLPSIFRLCPPAPSPSLFSVQLCTFNLDTRVLVWLLPPTAPARPSPAQSLLPAAWRTHSLSSNPLYFPCVSGLCSLQPADPCGYLPYLLLLPCFLSSCSRTTAPLCYLCFCLQACSSVFILNFLAPKNVIYSYGFLHASWHWKLWFQDF